MIRKLLARGKCRALLRRATAVSHNGRMFARLMPAALNVESLSAVDAEILAPKCGSLRRGPAVNTRLTQRATFRRRPSGSSASARPFGFLSSARPRPGHPVTYRIPAAKPRRCKV